MADARRRSRTSSTATAVGGFVLGGLVLCVAAILLFSGSDYFTTKLRVVAYFQDSVAGLAVGAPVTLRGVQIGTVRAMRINVKLPELVPVIPVYMDIEPGEVSWSKNPQASVADLELAIKAGLRAQLATQSLVTGQASVNLDFQPGTPANFVAADPRVPEIPTIPSDIQHIKDEIKDLNLPELTEKARSALTDIDRVVVTLQDKVGPVADSLKQTSDSARTSLEALTDAVKQIQGDASRTLQSIDKLATTTTDQVRTSGAGIDKTLASVRQVADHADKVLASIDSITGPHAPMRDDLASSLRDLSASASSLRDFTHELERQPNAILLGKSR